VDEREVILEVIDPNGNVTDRVVMDESVLDDLPGLFRKLPDGHYRIKLKEAGERAPRLLLDVTLRGGRPENTAEGEPEAPPGDGAGAPGADAVQEMGLVPAVESSLAVATIGSVLDVAVAAPCLPDSDAPPIVTLPAVVLAPAASQKEIDLGHEMEERNRDGLPAVAASAFSAVSLVVGSARSWEDRVDEALAEAGAQTLSKAARLARRVRRPMASRVSLRLRRRRGAGSGEWSC
jgi:hypothetical protein